MKGAGPQTSISVCNIAAVICRCFTDSECYKHCDSYLLYILSYLHSTATKELVDKYEKQRQHFMASTTLNQFKQLFPASATPFKLSAAKVLITVKLKPYWGDNTVDDLTTLVNSFGVPGSHLHLYNVQKGCIASIWLCPAVDFKELRGIIEAANSLESKGVLQVFAGEGEIMWECSRPDQGND